MNENIKTQNLKAMSQILCNEKLFTVLGISEKTKHLLNMRWKENMFFAQIAAQYNVSQQRARVLYLRSLSELNKQLNASARQLESINTFQSEKATNKKINILPESTLISDLSYNRPKVINLLNSKNIFTIADILEFSKKDLLCIRGLGVKSVWELKNLLFEHGYNLREY